MAYCTLSPTAMTSTNSGVNVPKRNWLKILIGFYIILVISDSATTYIGIKFFGHVELTQSWVVIFDSYGLLLGTILSVAYGLCFAWLFFKIRRRFKLVSYVGLSALTVNELLATVWNVGQLLS